MVSFDNTEIAFSSKSNIDLNRSYWLFTLISRSYLVKVGGFITQMALYLHLPIAFLVKATIFKQFCGGENIKDCDKTIDSLAKFHIGTILDYSVEGKSSDSDFDDTVNEIMRTIDRAKQNKAIPFSVFKVTGIAPFEILEKVSAQKVLSQNETISFEKVQQRVHLLCQRASESGVPILIDAEESWIQPAIDDLANEMMKLFNKEKAIVFNTYQMYRKDRLGYLKNSLFEAREQKYWVGAKVVRGAYMEKERKRAEFMGYPSPIQDSKDETDKAYNDAIEFCVENIDSIALCAGTHNEMSSWKLNNMMKVANIDLTDKRIYFSQLLGMSDHISYNLSNEGFNVAKYMPYGPLREVLPYLMRRAEENTSVKGQTGRELSLIISEKRRRQQKAA
ncbi:MAG: proline dehydrogenase family protein [Cytophagales bacterium]